VIDLDEEGRVDRGIRAERLLKDSLYVEAWDKVRSAILDKIEHSPVRDKEGREYLYLMLKALSDARGAVEHVMRDGKVAIHLREEKRRFKLFR
jgi:hypothetical protein